MSLSAWEQQALDSIKDGLAGSDPDLAALLSAFTWLASSDEVPTRENMQAGVRRALRRLRWARWRSNVRRAGKHLGFQRAALVLLLLTTAALVVVALALHAGGGRHGSCTEEAAMVCIRPARAHSSSPASHGRATGQPHQQSAVRTTQAGP
jgi:hypothetical protein